VVDSYVKGNDSLMIEALNNTAAMSFERSN